MAQMSSDESPRSFLWVLATAVLFGGGVWSVNFLSMLAYTPNLPVRYIIFTTIESVVVSVSGSLLSLHVWRQTRSDRAGACVAGILLGLTTSALHFIGVTAMQTPGELSFDGTMVIAAIAIGVTFIGLGIVRSGSLLSYWRQAEVAGWLVVGICGLHFTGMAGTSIDLYQPSGPAGAVFDTGVMAVAVGTVSLVTLLVCLVAGFFERRIADHAAGELRNMRLLSDITREAQVIHRDGTILQVNAACCRMFGMQSQQLIGLAAQSLFADTGGCGPTGSDRNDTGDRDNRTQAGVPMDLHVRTAAGLIPVEVRHGEIVYNGRKADVTTLSDLSERRRDEEEIRHLAHHDALTGLANRFLLRERLAHTIMAANRSDTAVALLYLDLDRFKRVNDLRGHAAGDALLVQVAARLRGELRAIDTIARIGGDEFVVVATIDRPEDAAALAARLVAAVRPPFDLDGQQAEIGASIGIALFPRDGRTQEELLHAADMALYRAKDEQRGTYHFFDAVMDEEVLVRRKLEEDLRHAIERNEFRLFYQPVVSCASGEVEGFEALIRWEHPERGTVYPGAFIHLAEETGLIGEMGKWALETACRTAAGWRLGQWVSVNMSPVQFRQSDAAELVAAILSDTGLPADRLMIEVTEGVFLGQVASAGETLRALRALGVRVALDDFGTGYSSLSYLCTYKFDKVKIDKSFISPLDVDPQGEASDAAMIVRAMIGLAHNLGLEIVAEGVETQRQLSVIRDYQCDLVQGFLLGRPLPMEDPADLIPARARAVLHGVHKGLALLDGELEVASGYAEGQPAAAKNPRT